MIKDGDIGNLYYKVVSRIRRINRKVQTPISPLIIFSITLLKTFCKCFFIIICGVHSNLRFSKTYEPFRFPR